MGSNQFGQLGLSAPLQETDGAGNMLAFHKSLPCLVEALQEVTIGQIAAGNEHTLALSEDGNQLFAWGQGKYGALGTAKS